MAYHCPTLLITMTKWRCQSSYSITITGHSTATQTQNLHKYVLISPPWALPCPGGRVSHSQHSSHWDSVKLTSCCTSWDVVSLTDRLQLRPAWRAQVTTALERPGKQFEGNQNPQIRHIAHCFVIFFLVHLSSRFCAGFLKIRVRRRSILSSYLFFWSFKIKCMVSTYIQEQYRKIKSNTLVQ